MQSSPVISLSPSFNCYSSSRLAEIAARVVEEFRAEADDDGGGYDYGIRNSFLTDYEESLPDRDQLDEEKNSYKNVANGTNGNEVDHEEGEEFEFAVAGRDFFLPPIPADEIFYDGQIRPYFPLFNQDLLLDGVAVEKEKANFIYQKSSEEVRQPPDARRLSLRSLFIEDRESPSSCSSSEADELDGVMPGSYCVWNPKAAEEARCKKSNSTGSSKRWRFRDILHRSNSDGKDSFVFSTPSRSTRNAKKIEEKMEKIGKFSVVAQEVHKGAGKFAPKNDGERRQMSFLPYRQDLVGVFSKCKWDE